MPLAPVTMHQSLCGGLRMLPPEFALLDYLAFAYCHSLLSSVKTSRGVRNRKYVHTYHYVYHKVECKPLQRNAKPVQRNAGTPVSNGVWKCPPETKPGSSSVNMRSD